MRVIDCNECGETLRGDSDADLTRNLIGHYAEEHDEDLPREDAEELVEGEAYEAMDS
ncbi:MAG TPA: hypothetical protein VM266_10230 [Solirubrobacteraceae bacterium]|nr:hypothetical protein [Solirubrobacteraceae bacterium]